MARFTLSLLLGFLVLIPSAYAQGSKELPACHPAGNEILIEIIDGDHLLIRIFDAEGNHIYPSLSPGSPLYHTIVPRTSCDWYGGYDSASDADWFYEPDKLAILEFALEGGSGDPEDVVIIGRYAYLPTNSNSPEYLNNFYDPPVSYANPDVGFALMEDGSGNLVVRSFSQAPYDDLARAYEHAFPAGHFVMPYDFGYWQDEGGESGSSRHFLTPLDISGPVPDLLNHPTYTFSAENDVLIPADWSITWDEPGLTVKSPAARRLVVEGDLTAEGVTFTAADPADGWHGVRFEPGSTGSLHGLSQFDPLTISEVNGFGASVYVDDAEVSLSHVLLDGRTQGSDPDIMVAGVYATGSKAIVNVHNTTITEHTAEALRASGGARIYASESDFADPVLSFGAYAGADVHLWENTSTHGASAQSYGTVWLGPPDYQYEPDLPNNNLGGGSTSAALSGWGNGEVWAGVAEDDFASNNHLFRLVGGSPGRGYASAAQHSDLTARYNWWGSANGPDLALSSVDQSSTFDYCPFLTDPVTGDPGGNCFIWPRPSGSLTANGSQRTGQDTAERGWGEPPPVPEGAAGHLWRAREAVSEGRPGAALGLLRQAAQEAGPDEEGQAVHRRALRLLASLLRRAEEAGDGTETTRAVAFLTEQAEGAGPQRPWALRALAHVAAVRGEDEGALALAEALVAEGGEHAVSGHIVRAFALASLNEPEAAEAALAEAEASAPRDEQVARAREELTWWLGRPLRSGARPGDGAAASGIATNTRSPVGTSALAVYPNPFAEAATVALRLVEAAEADVSVFDVLGRRVATLAEGYLEAGAHRLTFNGAALPAGVYVVRAEVGSRVLTQRLTVIR